MAHVCYVDGRTMTKIIEARDTDHMTAMECAARDSNDLVADLLMEFGAGLDGDFLQVRACVAVCVLQCVAVCCSVLQSVLRLETAKISSLIF